MELRLRAFNSQELHYYRQLISFKVFSILKINFYLSSFLFLVAYFFGKHVIQDNSMNMRSHIVQMNKKAPRLGRSS